ncbi:MULTISPECIES: extracellular solute-binding protein [Microbacterium]|uniref:Extracellular solute-binding protein n=1 Tax=Microbacterium wangchenii TaxID=2541726 RepID=A0ABX5SRY4_9MICO|nr:MULTISPECIES: extracellular solute-binding protein [Microbacterium]MCK6066633.1 extracellular solute-binding protein [Microbacterium sp. EYE_512]QBR87967.1 extracellular solute-binding protein [Microbacterium wangchenii]TFV83910.1 extracellular solute-binding protein [Microbacterium sp. dk485]TXK18243.1 extracellular solute-binding protein [Microbacterium wangchenii]
MNRKLASLALAGASALALAGCAGGGGGGGGDGAEIRVWLVGTDTPQAARDHLVETFEEENPGSTLVIEEQTWDGLVDKLTTSLSSSDSPDIVEFGNTQAPAFTSVGALLDISDIYEDLGGDDLLPGFVEAGSFDGAFYAAPLYSGARVVFADPAFVSEPPATLDEYVAQGMELAAANPGMSGVYFAGQDWYNALPFIWEHGGEIAVPDGEEWDAQFSSPESLAGLTQVQQLMTTASTAPKDGDNAEPWTPYCEGAAIQFSAPNWALGLASECETDDPPAAPLVYALPGADGDVAQAFAGGSNIGISANSANPDLAKSALQIILSDEFQTIYGENGLIPAKQSLAATLGDSPEAQAFTAAAANAKLTPASPNWAEVEASRVLEDFFVQVAQGGDLPALAEAVDTKIEDILNG